jgi:alkanesulfonate monooxygenase SsuD/methylene tetrahydromethanopterin reductase-like flavin-dependent oxidoreductase (luciferase family)
LRFAQRAEALGFDYVWTRELLLAKLLDPPRMLARA